MADPRNILVEIFIKDDDKSKVGFKVQSEDGHDLTAQEILDAVADCLLYNYDYSPIEDPQGLDS